MQLFDQKERILEGAAAYNADIYAYYNDSARVEIGNIRDTLESWFVDYPETEKEELKTRFKVAFHPAFFELYIYALFTRLGYSLEIHPQTPNSTTHPDYLARNGSDVFYVEVKHMTMLSHDEKSNERRQNELLDALNKIDASIFLLKLEEIIFKDNSQPSGKKIIRFFNKLIAGYDPDFYTEQLINHGFDGLPELVYEDEKVKIATKLVPKSPAQRGENSRSIASHPTITIFGNDSENNREALESKASRYGILDAPYIICLNKQSVTLDIIELQESLYGSLQVSWSENPADRQHRLELAGDGFFGSKHNPKATRVSGVYFTNVNPSNLSTTADHAFRHNHFAKFPINLSISQKIDSLFNIPTEYPF